ncbi:MAG: hypothetical protein ABID38_03790 [Candidatus Diapherotrites archaeon]
MTLDFLQAFILTNIIEIIPFYLILRKEFPAKELVKTLLAINAITLPLVWLILPFGFEFFLIAFLIVEIAVVVAETTLAKFFLKNISWKMAFTAAFAMNFLSAAIGLLI